MTIRQRYEEAKCNFTLKEDLMEDISTLIGLVDEIQPMLDAYCRAMEDINLPNAEIVMEWQLRVRELVG